MATQIHSYRTYSKTIIRYGKYSSDELKALFLGIIVYGFIFSYKDWGVETFDLFYGLKNLLIAMILTAITFVIHISAQKAIGARFGYSVEFKGWIWGLIIGLLVAFVSRGNLWFVAPGGILVHHLAGHRLGYFRYGLNQHGMSIIAVGGCFASLLFAILKTSGLLGISNYIIPKLILINLFYAFFSVLPIPPLDGIHILYDSRAVYVFVLAFFILLTAAIHFFGFFFSLIISLIVASIAWVVLWNAYEY